MSESSNRLIIVEGYGSSELGLYRVLRETEKQVYVLPEALRGKAMWNGSRTNAYFPKTKVLVDHATEALYDELTGLCREQYTQSCKLHKIHRDQTKALNEQHKNQRQEVIRRHQQHQHTEQEQHNEQQ